MAIPFNESALGWSAAYDRIRGQYEAERGELQGELAAAVAMAGDDLVHDVQAAVDAVVPELAMEGFGDFAAMVGISSVPQAVATLSSLAGQASVALGLVRGGMELMTWLSNIRARFGDDERRELLRAQALQTILYGLTPPHAAGDRLGSPGAGGVLMRLPGGAAGEFQQAWWEANRPGMEIIAAEIADQAWAAYVNAGGRGWWDEMSRLWSLDALPGFGEPPECGQMNRLGCAYSVIAQLGIRWSELFAAAAMSSTLEFIKVIRGEAMTEREAYQDLIGLVPDVDVPGLGNARRWVASQLADLPVGQWCAAIPDWANSALEFATGFDLKGTCENIARAVVGAPIAPQGVFSQDFGDVRLYSGALGADIGEVPAQAFAQAAAAVASSGRDARLLPPQADGSYIFWSPHGQVFGLLRISPFSSYIHAPGRFVGMPNGTVIVDGGRQLTARNGGAFGMIEIGDSPELRLTIEVKPIPGGGKVAQGRLELARQEYDVAAITGVDVRSAVAPPMRPADIEQTPVTPTEGAGVGGLIPLLALAYLAQ